jgi:hypothetical protein
MSALPDLDPKPGDARSCDAIEQIIVPRARDLGGFEVRRALPSTERQMVGPFIFLDQMGPAEFRIGQGVDVRPHPHIGLATVTYLFEGEITHRDSLGNSMVIRPGAVNLMTAGRGIAHSERTPPQNRASGPKLYGLQTWLALPKAREEVDPAFVHHGRKELPLIDGEDKRVRVILGKFYGERSPVATLSETIYAEALLAPEAVLPFDPEQEERGIYIVAGEIEIGGVAFTAGRLLVLRPGDSISIRAVTEARLMLVGGATMDGPRHIWWNFVSSSQERIEAAKADWKEGRFTPVPGDDEFIPLP